MPARFKAKLTTDDTAEELVNGRMGAFIAKKTRSLHAGERPRSR
jgi:hypothetical protein